MRNNGHLILRMCGNYALVTFPGNPNVYGVLPENVLDFRARYRSVLSWRGIIAKEEEKDEIYFLCKMYRTLKEKDEIPANTKDTLYFQFKDCLVRQTMAYAAKFGFNVSSVNLRTRGMQKLGSCSQNGDISYNPILIEYGPMVIKETILHELCHTVHHNHRMKFWILLERCLVECGLTDISGYVIPELFNIRKDYYIVNPITLQYPKIYTGYRKCCKNPDLFRSARAKDK